jgi:hypothetical protein
MMQVHAAATNSKVASYHEFLARYSRRSRVVYGFVEGKQDPAFYRGFIDQLLPDGWDVELWPAGNKDQVYRIHGLMDWRRFPKSRVCSFVDRDLSDVIPETLAVSRNIYVTDGYSIENDIVNRSTLKRVLSELCGFSRVDHAELDALADTFAREFDVFLRNMISIMSWIVIWRRSGQRPNLNEIQMGDLFMVKDARLVANASPKGKAVSEYIHERCKVTFDGALDTAPITEELRKENKYKRFTRGKYCLWFLVEYCNSVHRDAAAVFPSLAAPPKMNLTLSCANGMAIIGARARCPASLRNFLRETFLRYVARKLSIGG